MIKMLRRLNEATPKNALQNNDKTTVSFKWKFEQREK